MPYYTYKCKSKECEKKVEFFRAISNRKLPVICPFCKKALSIFEFTPSNFYYLEKGRYKRTAKPDDPFSGIPCGNVPGDKEFEYLRDDPNNPDNWMKPKP